MKSGIALVAAYAWVLFIAGCSTSLDEAKLLLQQRVASQSLGHIKLVSFTRTDVQEFQVKGVQGCRITYTAEIEFEENGLWSRGVGKGSLNFEFRPNPRTAEGKSASNPRVVKGGDAEMVVVEMTRDLQGDRQMSEGDRIKIIGAMTGTKSKNGWRYELSQSRITD